MNVVRTVIGVGLVVLVSSVVARADDSAEAVPTREQVREVVGRSLPYLETAGVSWIENKKCVTCHRVAFLTWSHAEASRRGFAVDLAKNRERVEWSVQSSLEKKEKASDIDGALNIDGLAQILLGHSADPSRALTEQQRATRVQISVKGQQPDGSWKAGDQLPGQKRPKDETA